MTSAPNSNLDNLLTPPPVASPTQQPISQASTAQSAATPAVPLQQQSAPAPAAQPEPAPASAPAAPKQKRVSKKAAEKAAAEAAQAAFVPDPPGFENVGADRASIVVPQTSNTKDQVAASAASPMPDLAAISNGVVSQQPPPQQQPPVAQQNAQPAAPVAQGYDPEHDGGYILEDDHDGGECDPDDDMSQCQPAPQAQSPVAVPQQSAPIAGPTTAQVAQPVPAVQPQQSAVEATLSPNDAASYQCQRDAITRMIQQIDAETGFRALRSRDGFDGGSIVERALHVMQWEAFQIPNIPMHDLVSFEAALAANQARVRTMENEAEAVLEHVGKALDRIMRVEREGFEGRTVEIKEANLVASNPALMAMRNDYVMAQARRRYLASMGDSMNSVANGIKRSIDSRIAEREYASRTGRGVA